MTRPVANVFPAISIEGNLLASATIDAIAMTAAGEQSPTHYGLREGLSVRDEISLAFRVAQAHVKKFQRLDAPGRMATIRFSEALMREAFGFQDIAAAADPLAMAAGGGRVPVVVVPPSDSLDRASESLSPDRRRSAAFALQDHLNAREDALWGLATNGATLRLMRDNASLTRPAWLEANLLQIAESEDIASFALLWLTIHRTRFGSAGTPATDCSLERWREAGTKEGEAARDKLAAQVERALRTLGTGFLEANPHMRGQLSSGQLSLTDWFNELLRLVYRLIFLMVAEDRHLLHFEGADDDARDLYARGYSLTRLRELAVRRAAWDRHHDRYEGLKVVFRALARGEPMLALPALGGLFGASQLPNLDHVRLPNRALMEAIYRLSWIQTQNARVPVNWRAMETEELGSVYESLLELQPQLTDDGRVLVFAQDAAEARGNQRKTTGSYYTPDSLVQALLDTTLDPVLDRTEAEAENSAEALLTLTVIDPACGSGHFLLAAARRIATRVARHRAEGTPSAADFRHALRDVARRCIHGVDRNPMAVELTKVALWIETVDPGLPLGFFDAQIRCGDALLGVFDLQVLEDGIPDDAYKPLAGDDRVTANYYKAANRDARSGQGTLDFASGGGRLPTEPLKNDYHHLRDLPEETVEQVRDKARAFRSLREGKRFHMVELACNLYTAAFLLPKTSGEPTSRGARMIPTSEDVWEALAGRAPYGPLFGKAEVARDARAFHWPLEFPDAMASGGFDVVIGNPPWERIKLQEKEFFAARDPEIATAPNAAARTRLINALHDANPGTSEHRLWQEFEATKRLSEATSTFVRVHGNDGGRYPFTGTGDVNTYALFAELFATLAGPKGRAGVIVPTGIATDATTAPFFAHLVAERRLSTLIDFENAAPIFPAVHRSFKFSLLTLGRNVPEAHFAFFLHAPAELAEPERNFTLSPEQIEAINPNTKTAPVFRSRADAELTAKIYRNAPVLIDEGNGPEGNPWSIRFHTRIWHMAEDSELFRTAPQLSDRGFDRDGADWIAIGARPRQGVLAVEGAGAGELDLHDAAPRQPKRFVPLYEAKMVHQFDHRWASYDDDGTSTRDCSLTEKEDPFFEPITRYWVPSDEVRRRLRAMGWGHGWLLGWRDIARATDERTLISGIIPAVASGDKFLLMFPGCSAQQISCLYANLNALSLDFAARQKVGGTAFKLYLMRQMPVFPTDFYRECPGRC